MKIGFYATFLMFFVACSSDSNEPVKPDVGEESLSSSSSNVLQDNLLSSAANAQSSAEMNLSSDALLSPMSSASEEKALKYQIVYANGDSVDQELMTGIVKYVGSKKVSHDENQIAKDAEILPFDSRGEYDRVSFVEPCRDGSLDTVVFDLGGECTENAFCYIGEKSFHCFSQTDCQQCFDPNRFDKPQITEKTLYLNYGPNKVMDYLPQWIVPALDSSVVREALADLKLVPNDYISVQIQSNYTFTAKGLPEGLMFKDSPRLPTSSSSSFIPIANVMNACVDRKSRYPWPYRSQENMSLFNANEKISIDNDTTITWTLLYTNQNGVTDSLAVTTKFVK